jgi:hypothetical protein
MKTINIYSEQKMNIVPKFKNDGKIIGFF